MTRRAVLLTTFAALLALDLLLLTRLPSVTGLLLDAMGGIGTAQLLVDSVRGR